MKKIATIFFFLLAFSLAPYTSFADISVTLNLDRNEATLSDTVRMTISIKGSRESDLEPVIHGLESFDVMRCGTSSRFEFINGSLNSGVDYQYSIRPQKAGTFKIGPVELKIKGKTIRSGIKTLKIVERARTTGLYRGSLFLSAGVSPAKVYVEEQAVYTLKLYHLAKVKDLTLDLPDIEHLQFKQLGKPVQYQGVYNGTYYNILEVRYAITPLKEGIYEIRPSKLGLNVYESGQISPFDMFNDNFFDLSAGRPTTLTSEPLELNVIPIPHEGRPQDFSGLVGSFRINTRLEPSELKAGESATLTVTLSGRGNINRIPDINGPELENVKVYADQPVIKVAPDSPGPSGSKTMKWALVPEKEGRYRIKPVSISFFDTVGGKYRVIKTPALLLLVRPGGTGKVMPLTGDGKSEVKAGPAKKEIKELGHDILPVHTSIKDIVPEGRFKPGTLSFLLIFLGPCFVYLGVFTGTRYYKKKGGSKAFTKAKSASGIVAQRCKKAGISSSEMTHIIRDYINDRFGQSHGVPTPDEAAEIIRSNGAGADTVNELRAVLQTLEDAVYTGKGNKPCNMEKDIRDLIKRIEKESR
ncbi:MAG: hypothetical protein B1H11_01795 [Desulfobacteraceae bacterium 4484_190.1]|nr:MAG: hypothetical protein B1H11_01795 [Desulfobacteraceae bacterium 4484_190.1]